MNEQKFVNRYKVIAKIGEGGMGTIWKVFDEVDKKEVALKEIKLADEDRSGAKEGSRVSLTTPKTGYTESELRFAEEFRTMTKLQYPFTLKVFDYGVLLNGNRYITMEIVEGENLRDRVKNQKLDFQEIYRILIQLSQTLSFIHSRLYVHRDIKSENIMITKDGPIKLMDFGLMDQLGVASDGTITGTIQYLPPEVVKSGVINESSDLYSVGVLAYELATGEFPFSGKSIMDVVRMHIKDAPKPPHELRADIPEELEKIILKLLEKEQSNRYENASKLIEDLSKLSNEEIVVETKEQRGSYLFCSELIGRAEETTKLREVFEDIKSCKGKSVFVGAPAGVGKTRLLQEFKLETQLAEVPFLEGFCIEQGMNAYQPFREALKPVFPMTPKNILDKYGPVLVKVFPELEKKGFKAEPVLEELGEKSLIYENVTKWLKEVSSENPLAICFEDLHWSDTATLGLLNACIRELRESPILIIGTYRDDEVDETSSLYQTLEENITIPLTLTTLNKENIAVLVGAMLGKVDLPEEFLDELDKITGGNPYFVTETIRSLIDSQQIKLEYGKWILIGSASTLELPTSIESTVSRRLDLLSKEAYDIAQIGSVMGRELNVALLESISTFSRDVLFSALDELVERQFIKREDRRYTFTHDRVRETLYSEINEARKREIHEKVGRIIERGNKANVYSVINILAYHFSRGESKEEAVKYLIMAADGLVQKASYVEAIDLYNDATDILETIDYPDKQEVLFVTREKLVFINSYAVKPDICAKACEKNFETLFELGGGEKTVKKQINIMKFMLKIVNALPGGLPDAVKGLLMKEYPPNVLPKKKDYMHILTKLIEFNFMYTASFFFLGHYAKALANMENVEKNILPERNSIPHACLLAARQTIFCGTAKYGLGKREMDMAIPIFTKYESKLNWLQQFLYTSTLFWINNHTTCGGGREQSKEHRDKALELAEKYNFVEWMGWQAITDHVLETIHGRIPERENAYENVCDISKRMGRPFGLETWIYAWRSLYAFRTGYFDDARKAVAIIKRIEKQEVGAQLGYAQLTDCLLLIEAGKIEEAFPQLEGYVKLHREHDLMPFGETLYEMAMLYLQLGRTEDAKPLLDELLERASGDVYTNYNHQIMSYRAMGYLAMKEKDYESAQEKFGKSLEIAERQNIELQMGLTNRAYAEMYVELTQHSLAKEYVNKASEIFSNTGNEYLLKKLDDIISKINSSGS
ncbi:MAG: protein kinase [Elusimicrobiota bacterium]